MDLTEFCKDMPERQPVDPNDYVPIDMYPGYEFYIGKPNVALRSKIYILIRLAGTDLRELKRLLEEWFFLYPNKKHLIDQIRKYTIRDRGNRIPNKSFMKMVSGIEHYEIMDVLSKFVDEHTVSLHKDHSAQPEGISVDDILNDIFSLTTSELENLKNNLLKNGKQYISLTYIGTKAKLWTDLGKLLSAGIKRNEISRVFSEYCYWQKSTASVKNKLDSEEIYKKIGKKGTK